MKRGFDSNKGKPVILGISSSKRDKNGCAREDSVSLYYLKLALKEAEKAGAITILLDLRNLKIGACKECYSSCPAQCRFNEEKNQCDCYPFKHDSIYVNGNMIPMDIYLCQIQRKTLFLLEKL